MGSFPPCFGLNALKNQQSATKIVMHCKVMENISDETWERRQRKLCFVVEIHYKTARIFSLENLLKYVIKLVSYK